jgi:uncharacterized caspase-like protein
VQLRIITFLLLTIFVVTNFTFSQDELYVDRLSSIDAFNASITRGAVAQRANLLAVISSEKTLRLYQIPSLKEKSSLINLPSAINDISFSASGSMLALGAADGQVHLFDVSTGAISRSLAIHSQRINALIFQDEGWIFSAGIERTVAITDAINASAIGSVSSFEDEITTLAIQPDAQNCAVGLVQGRIDIITLGSLSVTSTLNDAQGRISALCYSADGKFLAAGTSSGNVFLWDAQSGVLQKKFEQKAGVASVVFDPKTRWLISTSTDGIVNFYDLALLSNLKTVTEINGYITYATFLNDETLLTTSSTGQIKSWRVSLAPPDTTNPGIAMERPVFGTTSGKAFGREYEIQGLVYDDIGLKDVKVNNKSVALKAISDDDTAKIPSGMKAAKRFTSILKLDSVGSIPFEVKVLDKANHSVSVNGEIRRVSKNQAIEITSPLNNSEVSEVTLPVRFQAWFDVASYSISNNMVDIVNEQVPRIKAVGDEITDTVSLFLGYNQIQLSVTSKSGDKFSKILSLNRVLSTGTEAPTISTGAKKERNSSGPQSWAVIVGVSDYKNPGVPSLKYADKDAESLANFLRRPEGGGYDSEHMRVLLNKDATLANVKDALINFLNQAIDMDLVFIYFAGHGAPEPARPQNIYLLTYDSDPMALGTSAFPMWDIQTVLARYINAKRVIVFSDACHSGNISVNFATRGVGVTEQNLVNQYLTDLSKSKQGVVVFTASASGEVSQEFPEMAHGVFTYYILEGMNGKADYNNDYTVTINELMQYVEEQVKRKTRGAQNPTRSQTDYDKEMTISLIPH